MLAVYPSAQDFEKIQIQTVKITDSVYMLAGGGGNIGVSVGKDGILLVDTQFAELVEKINAAVKKINGGPIRYVINTHMHYDHTNGNELYGKAGAFIIAHDNVRKGMKSEWSHWAFDMKIPPYPEIALPVITYTDSMTIHFNDEEIHALYLGNAHTDGDTVVYFRKANAIHMGDLYFNGGYPFIDVPHGGSVNKIIEALSRILGKIDEARELGEQPEIPFTEGDAVKVVDGPFNNFTGFVEEVYPDKMKVKVMVSIFGRKTPLELDYLQVEHEE